MSARPWEVGRKVAGLFRHPYLKCSSLSQSSLRNCNRVAYQLYSATAFHRVGLQPFKSLSRPVSTTKVHRNLTELGQKKSESVCRLLGTRVTTSRGVCFQPPLSDNDLRKAIEKITESFMEARELLDDAKMSRGTVYFVEDMKEAEEAVVQTLKDYETLLASVTDDQNQNVLRTIGLRMEELKAQLQNVQELLSD